MRGLSVWLFVSVGVCERSSFAEGPFSGTAPFMLASHLRQYVGFLSVLNIMPTSYFYIVI